MFPRASAALLAFAVLLPAQTPVPPPTLLPGTRLLAGGGKLPPAVFARFLERAGGADGRVVLIPTASETADSAESRAALLQRWQQDHPGPTYTVLHTRDRAEADREDFAAPLRAATGVWIGGGAQERLAAAYLGTRVERELQALLARGGVVAGTSAGTAIQTRTMIQEGMDPPVMATGFDLVPFAISDQHFLKRQRLPRLLRALAMRRGHFGLGIDEGTAVEVHGRTLTVLGESKALLVLAAAGGWPERVVTLAAGEQQDLVAWQRAAVARLGPAWPPAQVAEPAVPHGAVLLHGGGALTADTTAQFLALAGGAKAVVVAVPSAAPTSERRADPMLAALRAAGATVRELDAATPAEVTAALLAQLDTATGVWFGGGRQWRLCDAFDGTGLVEGLRAVLGRGGVVGGTSAGATILGELLVRGDPIGNTAMWCEGYQRGFALVPGVAIDQHFVVRERLRDLQGLLGTFPQFVGLGLDEGAAVVVRGHELEALGSGKVAVLARGAVADGEARAAAAASRKPVWLDPGARWDLRQAAGR